MTNASEQMDQRIKELGDWRGQTLAEVRQSSESRSGNRRGVEVGQAHEPRSSGLVARRGVCTGESYKNAVKPTFYKGASLAIRPGSSTPAWRGRYGAPSISTKAKDQREGTQESRPRSRGAESGEVESPSLGF